MNLIGSNVPILKIAKSAESLHPTEEWRCLDWPGIRDKNGPELGPSIPPIPGEFSIQLSPGVNTALCLYSHRP